MAIDLSSPLLIDSDLELVLILPYRLGVRSPLPGPTRLLKFPAIAAAMNDRVQGFVWRAATLGWNQEPVPTFVAARKKVVLLGEPASAESDRLVAWIRNLEKVADLYDVRAARQSIWYYDWGFGAVDIKVMLRIRTSGTEARPVDGALTQLLEIGNEIAFHSRTMLAVFRDWAHVSAAMIGALEAQPFLPDAPDEARELSGRLPYYLVGLVVAAHAESDSVGHDSDATQRLSVADVTVLADGFTGRPVQLAGSIQWPGVAAVAEGYGGVLAILDADDGSAGEMRDRIVWLWRLVAVYVANLEAVGRVLSRQTLELFREPHPERTPGRLAELRRDRLGLQALLQECTPLSVCGTALEKRVYAGIWEAWSGDRLFADVSGHLDFIREYIREAVDALAARTQNRLGWILTVLNILTFAAAIATIITTYDWHNEELYPWMRIAWIAVLTLLFGVVTLLVMLFDRLRRKPAE